MSITLLNRNKKIVVTYNYFTSKVSSTIFPSEKTEYTLCLAD